MNHVKKFTVLSWERDWIKYSDPNYSTWPIFFATFFYLGLDSNMKYFELLKLSRVSLRVSEKNSLFHVLTIILCSVGYSDSTDNLKVMGWISIRVQELSKLTLRHRIILKKLIFSQEVRIEPTHSRCRWFYADWNARDILTCEQIYSRFMKFQNDLKVHQLDSV